MWVKPTSPMEMPEMEEEIEPLPWGQGSIGTLTEYSVEETSAEKKKRLEANKKRTKIGFY